MPRTPEQHSSDSRLGAYVRLMNTSDWSQVTAAARAAGPANLEWHANKIDPDGNLPAEQRLKMAEAARKAYYLRLSAASCKARAGRKAQA
jgi:hypothetical protein